MAQVDLNERFPSMTPVKRPPALMRMNGCGVSVYGARDHDQETGTYVTTWCIALLFIPVFCLRAYRVARAPSGGWFFIGREPLSALARGWNGLVIALILAGIGLWQFDVYTSSPEYKAKKQMEAARVMVTGGQLSEAATIYQRLAIAHGPEAANASAAIADLLNNQCAQAPLGESAGVVAAAAEVSQVARGGGGISKSDVAAKGFRLAADNGDSNPRAAIAILDAIRPLVSDTSSIDQRRLPLLKKWVAKEPTNLNAITPLALLLEQQNESAEARKLLLPVKDKLGDSEGARILGMILGHEGDFDGSYAVLWPYAKNRLERLHSAEKALEDTLNQGWEREINLLKEGKGPADFYQKYDAAGKDQQRGIVREYVNGRLKNDPQYRSTQEALEREAPVVPVAMELGIVMLQRAQAQHDGQARKAQLEAAEKVFLAIGGVAGESDVYRISLGQVYYWLGKQAEGRKLFDDYLASKNRAAPDLVLIAIRLRQVGAVPDARAMAEEAYNTASKPEEKYNAASVRALCFKDTDDQIAWLRKADPADPSNKAELARVQGQKAYEEGREQEATQQYRSAIAAYDAMPRTASTLNQTALAYYALFQATGDLETLDRCFDYFQQAVNLEPSDPILLFNAGMTLLDGSLAEVIGSRIDLKALRETGSLSLLGYLYRDQPGRDAVAQKIKEHQGIARAISLLEKVMVLSPKSSHAASAIFGLRSFTREDEALVALESRIRAAELDTTDQLENAKELLTGAKDEQNRVGLTASLKRCEDLAKALRPKGGTTAAVAITQQVETMLGLDIFNSGASTDAARVVALAEEAHRLAPSESTLGALMAAHLFAASKELRQTNAAFDAYFKKYERSIGYMYVMIVAASEPGPFKNAVCDNAHVRKAADVMRQELAVLPQQLSPHEWALLHGVEDGKTAGDAQRAADVFRQSPFKLREHSISALLHPTSAGMALDTYWLMQSQGKGQEGRAAIRKVVEAGIPMPIE
jgi:tetratricopeptide (TPR) repeat protein